MSRSDLPEWRDPHAYTDPAAIWTGAPGVSSRVPANFDPPDFWSGSELERMVNACEKATEDFADAVNNHSVAEAAYLRVFHTARARAALTAKSAAEAERVAQDEAFGERIAERLAQNAVESAKALMRTRLAVLSAAQTHANMVMRQT